MFPKILLNTNLEELNFEFEFVINELSKFRREIINFLEDNLKKEEITDEDVEKFQICFNHLKNLFLHITLSLETLKDLKSIKKNISHQSKIQELITNNERAHIKCVDNRINHLNFIIETDIHKKVKEDITNFKAHPSEIYNEQKQDEEEILKNKSKIVDSDVTSGSYKSTFEDCYNDNSKSKEDSYVGDLNNENISSNIDHNDEKYNDQNFKTGGQYDDCKENDTDEDGEVDALLDEMVVDYFDNKSKDKPDFEMEDDKRICKFFASKGGCWNGKYCTKEHTTNYTPVAQEKPTRLLYHKFSSDETSLVEGLEGKWLFVMVTAMVHPGNFYVVFPFEVENIDNVEQEFSSFQEFMNRLNEHYNVKHQLEMSDRESRYGLGEMVVVWSKEFERWARARVVTLVEQGDLFEIFYVDYGETKLVPKSRIRNMNPSFLSFPQQAFLANLPIVPPSSSSSLSYSAPCLSQNQVWSEKSIDLFESYVKEKVLLAFILDSSPDGRLQMLLYQTSTDKMDEENNIGSILAEKEGLVEEDAVVRNDGISEGNDTSVVSKDVCVAMVTAGMAEYSNTYPDMDIGWTKRDKGLKVTEVVRDDGGKMSGIFLPG